MKTAMKLAIETYAKLTNTTSDHVINECNNGNEVIIESIQKLMFSIL